MPISIAKTQITPSTPFSRRFVHEPPSSHDDRSKSRAQYLDMSDRNIPAAGGSPLSYQSTTVPERSNYSYPSVPHPQYPPPARLVYPKRLSEGQVTDNTRVQSSVSSASDSSNFSYRKHQAPTPDSHWPSPTCERTLVSSDQQTSTQWRSSHSPRNMHKYKKSEMTERQSTALSHSHERRQIEQDDDDEDEEDDHAIWILVRHPPDKIIYTTLNHTNIFSLVLVVCLGSRPLPGQLSIHILRHVCLDFSLAHSTCSSTKYTRRPNHSHVSAHVQAPSRDDVCHIGRARIRMGLSCRHVDLHSTSIPADQHRCCCCRLDISRILGLHLHHG